MLQILSTYIIPLLILNLIHRPSKYVFNILWLPKTFQIIIRQVMFLGILSHPYGLVMLAFFIIAKIAFWIVINDIRPTSIHDFIMVHL